MPAVLWLDCETYSDVPIKFGTFAYAEKAELLLLAWAIDKEPVHVWDVASGYPIPKCLEQALQDPQTLLVSHNAQFDNAILRQTLPHPLNQQVAKPQRWRCTLARALAHSLPASLGALCDFYGVTHSKDAGKPLIQLFSKPRPKHCKARRAYPQDHPEQWQAFKSYAARDVQAMREVAAKLPLANFKGEERALWHLDQTINQRGIAVDLPLVNGALTAVEQEQTRLAKRCEQLSGIESTRQVAALRRYLAENQGLALADLAAPTVKAALARQDLTPVARELLSVRQQASQSSTAKYQALANAVSKDGRLRGTLQFCGAARTGRWSGRVFQPQNLRRSDKPQEEIETDIEAFKQGSADLFCTDVMDSAKNAIRGCLVPSKGHQFIVADLANIEGRMLAYLAGEHWKLKAFADYDQGKGHDLYKIAYAKAFGIAPEDVTKEQRQLGKVMELMLGYGGGVGAFITGASGAGLSPEALAESAAPHIPKWALEEAKGFLAWNKGQKQSQHGLSDKAFIVCDALKRLWRTQHPRVVAFWNETEQLAKGQRERAGKICAKNNQNPYARVLMLPSGRGLYYWGLKEDAQGRLHYQGTHAVTRKWGWLDTYAGRLVENLTQAAARDVLAAAMPRVEAAGYRIVLTVHDELITEAPLSPRYSPEHLCELLAATPAWADARLPLAASGFSCPRYCKD